MTEKSIPFDIPGLVMAVLDAMVENIADQTSDEADRLHCQATHYDAIAAACTEKAQMARRFASLAKKEEDR
jgi:hypothetical protein